MRLFSLPSLALAGVLAPACSSGTTESPHVSIAPSLSLPKGLLDKVTSLTLTVLEGNVTCDDTIGQTSLPGGTDAATTIAKSTLGTSCANGIKFCGDLQIQQSDTPRVFSAVATDAQSSTLAIGCATVTVNQDALPVSIHMFRFLAPATCGDGVLQPTEQCEPGGTATCDANCQTNELLLSVGSTQTGTKTGGSGDKQQPSVLWPEQAGIDGRFFAFYTDHAATNGKDDVALRAMTGDLSPIAASDSPALSAGSIYLPNGPTFPAAPAPFTQAAPAAAFMSGKYYVVFEDDNTPAAQGIDIHLRSMDDALVADQTTALGINGGPAGTGGTSGAGEALVQGKPAIAAGPMNRLYIAWESGDGSVYGRTLTPPATLGAQTLLSTGTGNTGVSIAATTSGWVAVWLAGSNVKLRTLNNEGTPAGAEQTVNESGTVTERPRVASLPDGRFAVTWNAGGDIFVQRYDATGVKIGGDQAAAINDVVKNGDQTTPSIAGSSAAGGSYVAVWLDVTSSNINGRMLGGSSGFLFNNVNGQSSEFQASRSGGRVRANPVVAAGGTIPAVGVAWEDKTDPGAGIVARRIPVPSE